ncbi:alanine--glyoxylate aminotransferase-like isoform X1 [Branchiostoma floridae x Branchiostoma belcheri]
MLYLTRWRRVFTPTSSFVLRLYHMSSPVSSVGQSAPKMADKESSTESFPPPQELLTPLRVPQKTLLGPGPSNASPRVLAASALPLLGHLHPEFLQIMDEVKAGIQYAFQTRNELTLAVSGTGHAAMEAAVVNMVEPGDVVLVAVHGLWGERCADMCSRNGAEVRTITKPIGQNFTLEDIQKGIEYHKPCMFFICHGESSAGVLQPLDGIGDICHRNDCLLLVDSVASLGGTPLYMDQQGIDILYSGAQKVLGAPPGASPISFSPRARGKLARRKQKVPSFYFDMNLLSDYWGVGLQKGQPRKYHHTGPISSVYALREGLAKLAEEGLENCISRHQQNALLLHQGLQAMGLELWVKDKAARLPTVTVVRVPEGVNWKDVASYIMNKYSIEISGGLGASAGKAWRIGLMGHNCTRDNVELVLRALKDALQHFGVRVQARL